MPLRRSIALTFALLACRIATAGSVVDEARKALHDGDARRAAQLFEQAASQSDSLDAELGYIGASLEAGDFRNAASYSNLVAGEHKDSTAALAMQAYLLDRTGQTEQALALLSPGNIQPDSLLVAAHAQILIDRLAAARAIELIDRWFADHPRSKELVGIRERATSFIAGRANISSRSAPVLSWNPTSFTPFSSTPDKVRRAGNGVIVDSTRVLTLARLIEGRARIEVRNSLGHLREGKLESSDASGFAIIRLDKAYSNAEVLGVENIAVNSDAHFCFAFAYPIASNLDARYPAMSHGVVARRNLGANSIMQVTSPFGHDHDGSPIFDNYGRLIGLAMRPEEDVTRSFGAGSFAKPLVESSIGRVTQASTPSSDTPQPTKKTPGVKPSVEELYEKLAPTVVQIVVSN